MGVISLTEWIQLLSPSPRIPNIHSQYLWPICGKMELSYQYGLGHTWKRQHREFYLWIFLSGQAVLQVNNLKLSIILGINSSIVMAEDVSTELSSENSIQGDNLTGLRKIEDGSVISNIHTSKWRVFTDNGRDLFLQGKLEEAEKLFLSALQEAKEGFGGRDPHVAAAYNNLFSQNTVVLESKRVSWLMLTGTKTGQQFNRLNQPIWSKAELYRVKKAYDKAEPLYLEAVKILEESFGPEDIRVGAALHNLGQFYLVQRKLEEARMCYERALKIKRCVLGHGHRDYADTMYHLGTVLYLQGKEKDSETLIQDSIKILEDGGLGESIICLRRLRYLAQGWDSLDTVIAAETLGLTLQSLGNLGDAKDLLERCLEARKTILLEDHIQGQEKYNGTYKSGYGLLSSTQVAANMLYIARVEMLNSNRLRKINTSEAIAELGKAKDHLGQSIRLYFYVVQDIE
ncbi:unnamed protein product [Camellia sinensis]